MFQGESDPVFQVFGFAHSALVWATLPIVITWLTLHALNLFEATQWPTSFTLWLPLCSLSLSIIASIANYFVLQPHMDRLGTSETTRYRTHLAAATDKFFLTGWVLTSLILSVCGVVIFATPFYGGGSHYTNLTALSNITLFSTSVVDATANISVVAGGDAAIRRYNTAKDFDLMGAIFAAYVFVSFFNSLPAISLSNLFNIKTGPANTGVESALPGDGEHLAASAATPLNSKALLMGRKAGPTAV